MIEMKKLQLGISFMQASKQLKELIEESKGRLDADTIKIIKEFGELCTVTATNAEFVNKLKSELEDLEKMGS